MSKNIERKRDQNVSFNDNQKENISKIFGPVEDALQNMVRNLNLDYSQVSFRKAEMLEVEINNTRDKLRNLHLLDIAKNEYSFESGLFYNDLFSSCEKIGDHVFNVNEAMVGLK